MNPEASQSTLALKGMDDAVDSNSNSNNSDSA
jgi:hypothetical protein